MTGAGSEDGLVRLALRLGAAGVPGWSAAERRLARRAVASGPAGGPAQEAGDAAAAGAAAAAIRAGGDPLGEAFCRLRPRERRRGAGQTLTPPAVVAAMTAWAAGQFPAAGPARVVDPGTGSARFLIAAGRRWPGALLAGAETDPLAAITGRASLAAAGLARRARITLADYRSLRLPPASGPTLFIGNPPYVRHHQIPGPWKDWLRATARSRGLPVSSLAGLHVHFFLATALLARPGDAGALVTAAEWLDVNYGSLVRALLLGPLGGQAVHLLDPVAPVFADAAATSAITCFRPGGPPAAVRLRLLARAADLGELAGGRPVPAAVLAGTARWGALARETAAAGAARRPRLPAGQVELGELCRVRRGQVTGANQVWITAGCPPPVPARFLFPAVTRARELFAAGVALTDGSALRLVIDLPADLGGLPEADGELITRFLAAAAARGAAGCYIARHRDPWWRVRLREPAPILATYMARRPPAFVRNLAGARHVNIAHGLYPREPLPGPALDALAAYLRRSVRLDQGRIYAGGLAKFEPREMERIPVPAPDLL
ncbi:MAG: class I SAM-dependent methyltransferase [Gemmatimonadota bacterium]